MIVIRPKCKDSTGQANFLFTGYDFSMMGNTREGLRLSRPSGNDTVPAGR
jgi:hypothetical protein